jgi:hypothetical protein
MAIFSIPYIYDFIVGIITIIMMTKIATFNEHIKTLNRRDNEERIKLLEDVIIINFIIFVII